MGSDTRGGRCSLTGAGGAMWPLTALPENASIRREPEE